MEMTVYIQYRNLGREKLICIESFFQEVRMCAYKIYFLYPDRCKKKLTYIFYGVFLQSTENTYTVISTCLMTSETSCQIVTVTVLITERVV